MCPKNLNFTLVGGFSSSYSKQLNIHVRKCDQEYLDKNYPGETCAEDAEIERVLRYIEIFVPVVNQFFDENDLSSNPIKTTLNMVYSIG